MSCLVLFVFVIVDANKHEHLQSLGVMWVGSVLLATSVVEGLWTKTKHARIMIELSASMIGWRKSLLSNGHPSMFHESHWTSLFCSVVMQYSENKHWTRMVIREVPSLVYPKADTLQSCLTSFVKVMWCPSALRFQQKSNSFELSTTAPDEHNQVRAAWICKWQVAVCHMLVHPYGKCILHGGSLRTKISYVVAKMMIPKASKTNSHM